VKWLLRLSKAPVIPKQGDLVLRGERFQSKRLRRIWLRAAIIDLILYYGFFVRMRQFFLHYVLCDRFLEDTLLDFKRNFPEEDVSRWGLWRLLGMVAPRPSHRFLLLVTPDVSAQRSVEKNEPFPDSIQTLEWRYAWYRKMAEDGQWFVLDGREPVQVVHARIMSELGLCE
jgi:dTMP kinase